MVPSKGGDWKMPSFTITRSKSKTSVILIICVSNKLLLLESSSAVSLSIYHRTRSPSYGVYISQLIRFARVFSNVDDFNNRNVFLTAKLLKQGYRYHTIRKASSKFYYRHSELVVKYNIGLKTLLQQGISEPIF